MENLKRINTRGFVTMKITNDNIEELYLVNPDEFVKVNVNKNLEVDEDIEGKCNAFRVPVGDEFEYIVEGFCDKYEEVDCTLYCSSKDDPKKVPVEKTKAFIDGVLYDLKESVDGHSAIIVKKSQG